MLLAEWFLWGVIAVSVLFTAVLIARLLYRQVRDALGSTRPHDGGICKEVVTMPQITFDLTQAKAGANVVRRDNTDTVLEVVEFTQLPDSEQPVRVLFRRPDGTIYSGKRHRNGKRKLNKDSAGDLFIKTPDAVFANLYRDGTYDTFTSAAEANRQASDEVVHRAVQIAA